MKETGHKSLQYAGLYPHFIPVLVWLVAVVSVVWLFQRRVQRFEVLGLAQGRVCEVASACDGRLKTVSVELFEKVGKGQVLVLLDDELLKAQIATVSAEIEHLMAQLIPAQDVLVTEAANLETDSVAAQRRFCVDVENIRLRILELKTLIETDSILLEDLAVEVKIAQQLLDEDAIAPYQLQKAKMQYHALNTKIEANQNLLEQAKIYLSQAQQRRDEFAQRRPFHPSVDSALEPIRKSIKVQEKLIDELLAQCRSLIITSPIEGVVTQIQGPANQVALRRPGEAVLRTPGEVVLAGEPILVVAEARPSEIIAYVAEGQLGRVREGLTVEIIKQRDPPQIAPSQVVCVGPVVEAMPQQLWQDPRITQWGRPILVKVPPDMELVPGERVGIRGL